MIDRTPTARDQRAPLPAFEPVPRRKPRHDGWTPARQVAFIEALADTGSVTRAAAQVNMSTESAYFLRRQPGAEGFARAWEAALDMGVLRLKDEAFDRAITGELVPIIAGGKLLGYRRRRNDRLIMFILRHYGQRPQTGGFRPARPRPDAQPDPRPEPRPARRRRAAPEPITAPAPAPAPATPAHAILTAFAGLDLDAETQEQVIAVLAAGAARARALAEANNTADDPAIACVRTAQMPWDHPAALDAFGQSSLLDCGDADAGDQCWQMLDLPDDRDERDRLAAEHAARPRLDPPAEAPAIPAPSPAPPPTLPTPAPTATDKPKDGFDRLAEWLTSGLPLDEWSEKQAQEFL